MRAREMASACEMGIPLATFDPLSMGLWVAVEEEDRSQDIAGESRAYKTQMRHGGEIWEVVIQS